MTREHLWPAALHQRLLNANSQEENAFWLARLRKYIPSEPKIRDVCANCNNGHLSQLDSHICALFDKYFVHIPNHGDRVEFAFEYHTLKRWLLKMGYNCARIHNSPDLIPLERLRAYILGTDQKLGASVQVFVQLAYPEHIRATELNADADPSQVTIFCPEIHRTGHALFRPNPNDQKLLRTVFLRAFHFYVAYWEPGKGRAQQNDFEAALKERWSAVHLLRPSVQRLTLSCTGAGAWQTHKGATDGQFVFSDSDA